MDGVLLRAMRADERELVLDLLELAFQRRALFAGYMDWDPTFRPDNVLVACAAGAPIACVQIFPKSIGLRGAAVALGGIGSVATQPAWRRRGIAERLVAAAQAEMVARGMALSLLFGSQKLYARLGWVSIPQARQRVRGADRRAAPAAGLELRAFRDEDLPRVS